MPTVWQFNKEKVCGRKSNRYFKVFSSRWFGRGERKSICLTGQNSAVLHLMCLCKFLRFLFFSFFFFFSNFGNPAQERYRRYPETAISVNTLIAGFTVFFRLIVFFFFRVTPACTLTIVVNVIHFLREQMTSTGKQRNPAMEDDGQNFSTWFYQAALFSNSSDWFHLWKKIC